MIKKSIKPHYYTATISKVKYLKSAYYIVLFFVLKIPECDISFFFIKVKYLFYQAIMGHFFCQKKSKCRDFDEKINQTPLLYSDNFSKVKYLNSAYYIVLFFVLKIAKCRDFDQKINQTPLLHSDKFSKVKYLNSAHIVLCLWF